MKLIPDEYQRVEYIESVGGSENQWIDTGVQIESGLNFTIDFKPTSYSSGKYIMGLYDGPDFYLYFNAFFQTAFGSAWKNTTVSGDTNRHVFEYALTDNDLNVYENSTNILSTTNVNLTNHPTIKIAGCAGGSAVAVRTYSAKITKNGYAIRNLIPCYRKGDSVVGMYDTVFNRFYTNSGTGSFSKGSDVLEE